MRNRETSRNSRDSSFFHFFSSDAVFDSSSIEVDQSSKIKKRDNQSFLLS